MDPIAAKRHRPRPGLELKRLLVVGADPDAAEQVELALPSTDVVREEESLGGLVRAGRERFQGLVLRASADDNDVAAVLRAYRKVSPELFVVAAVDMWEEPLARQWVAEGLADEYVLLPIKSSEFISAVTPVRTFTAGTDTAGPKEVSREEPGLPRASAEAWHQRLARETTELIDAANLGLQALLDRICWSAIFLLGADFAQIQARDRQTQAGQAGAKCNVEADLLDAGKAVGKIQMHLPDAGTLDAERFGAFLKLLPGLIRLAGSRGELQELANSDSLTGLANRRCMMQVLEELLARAKERRFRVTFILFDFDDFKHYNDAYGHAAGDAILRESAILIRQCIRRDDLAARFGGDEFAVILWDAQSPRSPGSDHPRSPIGIMNRFRKLLRQHHFPKLGPQAQGTLTISGGLANFPWDAANAQQLIEKADQALLEAKRSGKNRLYLVGQGQEATGPQ